MDGRLEAVIRLHPSKAQEIRRLAFASPNFRSLCADFAAAKAALRGFEGRASSAKMRTEYEVLVEELKAELDQMLSVRSARELARSK